MKIFDKYKNRNRKDKSVFLLLFIVVFTIVIWILVINNLFNPLLAMILMNFNDCNYTSGYEKQRKRSKWENEMSSNNNATY